MGRQQGPRTCRWLGLLLLLPCGCGLTNPFAPAGGPPAVGDTVSQWHTLPGSSGAAGPPGQLRPGAVGQGAGQPMPPPGVAGINEQIALMSQRLASTEDERKVMAARMQQMDAQVAEKDRALALASREVQEATAQLMRTRRELQTWKKEVTNLRDRLAHMENDNKATLASIIQALEQILDRGQEGKAIPLPAPRELPKLP